MQEFLLPYASALTALLALAVLMLIQFAVADFTGIRAGHVPGTPVGGGHDSFLFRATRAHANSNENLPLLLLLALLCILLGASAQWTANWLWVYFAARAAHMALYYADLRNPRSAAFVVGTVAQLGLLALAVMALLR
jgi:uncharacterized MAPEG superfamily protein